MNSTSNITFKNKPKLSEHAINQDQNERRLALIPKIEHYLRSHELFKNKQISVEFFHTGSSGLVSLINTPQKNYVLKILLRPDGPKGEALFLKTWESIGIIVPHVYEIGMIGEHSYFLMDYIPGQTLRNFSEKELLKKEIFKKMGNILRQIHTTKAKGYGRVTEEGRGEYSDFKTWLLECQQTKNQLLYIQEHNLLPTEIFGSIEKVIKILLKNFSNDVRSTYCHWDFTPGNILNTEPLTVFDPVPTFNPAYLDIARSIIQTIGAGFTGEEVSKQFLDGYFNGNEKVLDEHLLQASILFMSYTKIPHWHRINETKVIENLKIYLLKNKYLLD